MTCLDHCKEAEVKSGLPKPALEGALPSSCRRKDIVARETPIYHAAERSQRLPMTGTLSLYGKEISFLGGVLGT